MSQEYRTHEQIVADVLSRCSVTDLRDQSNFDLQLADELFYRSKTDMQVVESGERNLIKFWKIVSGDKAYEVRRFKNFVFCSCPAFFFKKGKACKHVSVSTNVYCANCFELSARVGKYCYDCDMKINHFMKTAA